MAHLLLTQGSDPSALLRWQHLEGTALPRLKPSLILQMLGNLERYCLMVGIQNRRFSGCLGTVGDDGHRMSLLHYLCVCLETRGTAVLLDLEKTLENEVFFFFFK